MVAAVAAAAAVVEVAATAAAVVAARRLLLLHFLANSLAMALRAEPFLNQLIYRAGAEAIVQQQTEQGRSVAILPHRQSFTSQKSAVNRKTEHSCTILLQVSSALKQTRGIDRKAFRIVINKQQQQHYMAE